MLDWIRALFITTMGILLILLAPILIAIVTGAIIFGASVIVIWFFLKVIEADKESDKDSE